jgi:hypothetical protein
VVCNSSLSQCMKGECKPQATSDSLDSPKPVAAGEIISPACSPDSGYSHRRSGMRHPPRRVHAW